MTSRQIELVQSSFRSITPIAEQAAALFYARLFELDPSLRPLFRGDLPSQSRKLMDTLSLAVSNLDRAAVLLPMVRQLGTRHVSYGVRDHHYATVGDSLLWTLRQSLGAEFTREVEDAWTETYALLANTMRAAAAEAHAA
jgi:hemoglobin-like flavoprotein